MKGIIFNIDVLVAVIVAGIILFSVSSLQTFPEYGIQSNLYLSKLANDILIVMDKSGAFDSLNNDTIYNNLSSIVPDTIATRLNIETFELDGDDFDKVNETIVSYPQNSVRDQMIATKSIFLIFEDNQIRYYNTVNLEVWQR